MKQGLFITFEGGEGVGKTTQVKLLESELKSMGRDVILTREPGGTELADKIRKILVEGEASKMEPITEALLYLAARSDHYLRKIKPALEEGKVVICDRFHDSSVVYQGYARGVDINLMNNILNSFAENFMIHRTYLIDLDPKVGVKRSLDRKNNKETRFESMDLAFHERVRSSFLKLAELNSDRFLVLDGNKAAETLQQEILSDLKNIMKKYM